MDLILWRHADAVELDDPFQDAERPLTTKGKRQAERMAKWLNQHLPDTTRILVSPTRRTLQTAEALGRKFKQVDALGPDQTVDAMLSAARWPDAAEPVMVVGHQHTLGMAAGYLITGTPVTWSIRKCAVWWLRARRRGVSDEVLLQTVISPDRI